MKITTKEAIELLKTNPRREDILWIKDDGEEEPVVASASQREGKYAMVLMSNGVTVDVDLGDPIQLSMRVFVQLPDGVTWWDAGYEKYLAE